MLNFPIGCATLCNRVILTLVTIEYKHVRTKSVSKLYSVLQYFQITLKRFHIAPQVMLLNIKLGDRILSEQFFNI